MHGRREGSGDRRDHRAAVRPTIRPTRGGDSPDGRKVKATLHWVSAAHALDAEVRLYDRLFTVEDPAADRELSRPSESALARGASRRQGRAEPRDRGRGRRGSSSSASAISASIRTRRPAVWCSTGPSRCAIPGRGSQQKASRAQVVKSEAFLRSHIVCRSDEAIPAPKCRSSRPIRRILSGSARVKRLPLTEGTRTVVVYLVDFEPGGRTNWHTHSAPQLLLVIEGRGLVQKWGEPVARDRRGRRRSRIEPNEKHWHGAGAFEQNGALRRQPEPDNQMARARVGRPIPCILSCRKPSTSTKPSSPKPARRWSATRPKRRSPTSC